MDAFKIDEQGCVTMQEQPTLKREIRLFGGMAILTGIMVGSGIFFIGSNVLARTAFMSAGLAVLIWLIGGLITLLYGLIYAELGTLYPLSGGYYVYLRKAYGKPVAFMSGFMNFTLASSASIAVLALAFAQILANIVASLTESPLMGRLPMVLIAMTMIVLLSFLNVLGIRLGTTLMKGFMIVKAVPIIGIIFLGLAMGTQAVDWSLNLEGIGFFRLMSMIGFAVIATFFAYEGWTNLNNVAEEIDNPGRNLPRALILTMALVTGVYVLYNVSIFRVLSLGDIEAMVTSGNVFIGIPAAMALLGTAGMYLVMVTMLISVFGALNGCIMTFPRVYYAMAKDNVFITSFTRLHPRYQTPYLAIIGSGLMGIVLLVFSLDELISLIAFGAMIFNILIFATVFIFRHQDKDAPRPYKVWGYPVLPGLAIVITALLVVAIFVEGRREALIGALFILSGLPIYYLLEVLNKRRLTR
ncbi:MAG: amino acid permease [Acholeplasmatales bacterium]|nr:MAG: amino acid permease [Acholeplasmatales bacterium]